MTKTIILLLIVSISIKTSSAKSQLEEELAIVSLCLGESNKKLCKAFKLVSGHDFLDNEGVAVEEESIYLVITKKSFDVKMKLIKSKDSTLRLMSYFFKKSFLKILRKDITYPDKLNLILKDENEKIIQSITLNYPMLMYMEAKDISKSVDLALIYGNKRFYKSFIAPTIISK